MCDRFIAYGWGIFVFFPLFPAVFDNYFVIVDHGIQFYVLCSHGNAKHIKIFTCITNYG